jgi:diguanylate cyclase (GGDEF)-like protein
VQVPHITTAEPTFSPDIQLAAYRALHIVTKQVHSSLDLHTTLDAVAQGVVDGAGFGVAAVNLARPDGSFAVVSVAGDENARETMLGTVETADKWAGELKRSQPWASNLRFVDGRRYPKAGDLFTWVPDVPVPTDETSWHPLDALYAPLTAPSGEWVGVISVDLPYHGHRPDHWQLEILELFADHAAIAIQHARLHSALQEQEAQARHAATHDALTGLANRAVLLGAETAAETAAARAVLLIDLDGFKKINDTWGHETGDVVLRAVAERLQQMVPDADIIARVGGDEFVIVLSGPQVPGSVQALAARIGAEIGLPIEGRYGSYTVGASIGLALATTPVPLSELLGRADVAMYTQKRGRATGVA